MLLVMSEEISCKAFHIYIRDQSQEVRSTHHCWITTHRKPRSDLDFQTMMAMGPFSCLVLLSFLFGKTVTTGSRKINFGQCELSGVSLWELKDYFGTVKDIVQTQDNQTDVILLNRTVLQEIPASESCCLFRLILRFYTERVFKHYQPTSNLLRRKTSILANYVLSIKLSLKKCHDQNKCACGDESHRRFKLMLNEYEKLERDTAAIKALGEMDILFAWMEDIRN